VRPKRLVDVRGGRAREVGVERGSASLDGRAVSVAFPSGPGAGEIVVDGRRFRVASARNGNRTWVWCEGAVYEFEPASRGRASAGAEHGGGLAAPMPGRVRRLVAVPGAAVARGEVLLVLEAMKMEHAIRAPREGVLERFRVAEGDLVEAGAELAELAAADGQ
jgi:3-methylcrotonyl-CoA carboxylase alpha subunit